MPPIDQVLLDHLNPEQCAAASDPANEVLTLACAGSGKSRTLAYRIAWLLASGAPAESIVAFTFTEKAADSIKLRVSSALRTAELDENALGRMFIGTIHGYCQFLLGNIDARHRQFEVLDENRLTLYLVSRYPQLGIHHLRNARNTGYFATIQEVCRAWVMMNEELINPADVLQLDADLSAVLDALSTSLDHDEFIDFSLMQRLVVDRLDRGDPGAIEATEQLRHLLVDEYQDINPIQERLITLLHQRSQTLFVVGDDDQSIYGWRGADVTRIIEFDRRYPAASRHTLNVNYRSTPAIVTAADAFAAAELGAERIVKNPRAIDRANPRDFRVLWFATREDEANWVVQRINALLGTLYVEADGTRRGLTPADFAILMRSTRQNEPNGNPPRHFAFTNALSNAGIRYSLEAGGGLFDRLEVATLRSTFELLRNGNPDRNQLDAHYRAEILPAFPRANFNAIARVLSNWARRIHAPVVRGLARQRIYPQQLVYDLLEAFGIREVDFQAEVMQDIGVFSKILQDVETVYMSVDTTGRFHEILNFLQVVADQGYDSSSYEISQRPDAVTVSTVHKMKGLEFPVVFIVDVENTRFPKRRRTYNGWLPTNLLQNAIARGSYQSTRQEEARLFYTALTRAERYLYVSGCAQGPGWQRRLGQSQFTALLRHPEISNDTAGLPQGLVGAPRSRRIEDSNLPTTFSDVKYYLRCPRDYLYRKVYGFSPPIADLFGFGQTVHAAVAKLHESFRDHCPTPEEAAQIAEDIFHVKHVPQSRDPQNNPGPYERARDRAVEVVRSYATDFGGDFERRRQVEARFEIPAQQTVISGTIDLMLLEDAAGNVVDACVIDFKTMEGGDDPVNAEELEWTELALQVQLYARAARDVLGHVAAQGFVHLLKDNQRVDIPISPAAVDAAILNVEWAVRQIIAEDFPMRPHADKCGKCDFRQLCAKRPEAFIGNDMPPPLEIPGERRMEVASIRLFDPNFT
ncbi:MAG TPA: ATP-dependent DNA helicase [Azospirillum sp.]|nr:ATP-dependent DNA helicase [Azospirillum sp.]